MKAFYLTALAALFLGSCSNNNELLLSPKKLFVSLAHGQNTSYLEGSEVSSKNMFYSKTNENALGQTVLVSGCEPGEGLKTERVEISFTYLGNKPVKNSAELLIPGSYDNNMLNHVVETSINYTDAQNVRWTYAPDNDSRFFLEILDIEPYNSCIDGRAMYVVHFTIEAQLQNPAGDQQLVSAQMQTIIEEHVD
ncbi:hypothetical protein GC194_00990 [bacterium]|nr:hypothetical protein [bacterium]